MTAKDETPKGAQTTRPTDNVTAKATEKPAKAASRIEGAYQLGGVWYAVDGMPLTAPEVQQAHRAQDAKAAEARRKAMLGGAE